MRDSESPGKHIFVAPAQADTHDAPKGLLEIQTICYPHTFRNDRLLAECAPHLKPDESISGIFKFVDSENDKYTIELAVELPDTLASPDGVGDWKLDVSLKSDKSISTYLSNQLCTFHCMHKGVPSIMLARRSHIEALRNQIEYVATSAPRDCYTVMVVREQVESQSAAEAVNDNLPRLRDALIEAAARVSLGYLMHDESSHRNSHPIYNRRTFERAFLLISSSRETSQGVAGRFSGAQLWVYPPKHTLPNKPLSEDQLSGLSRYLSSTESSLKPDYLIQLSEACSSAGLADLAFLLAFFYCESVVSMAIQFECIRRGVSPKKYKESDRNVTMSFKSNILLKSLFSESPEDKVLKLIDRARRDRNTFVHEGHFDWSVSEVDKLIEACKSLGEWAKRAVPEAFL